MFHKLLPVILISLYALFVTPSSAELITSSHKKDSSRITFNWPGATKYELKQEGRKVTIIFSTKDSFPESDLLKNIKKDRLKLISLEANDKKIIIKLEMLKNGYAQTLKNKNKVTVDFIFDEEKNESKDPTSTANLQKKTDQAEDQVNTAVNDTGVNPESAPVTILWEESDDMLKLIFEFPNEVKAGAFVEGGDLWLFFDQATKFSWSEKAAKASKIIDDFTVYKNNRMTAVRIDSLVQTDNCIIYPQGSQWILEWSEQLKNETSDIEVQLEDQNVLKLTSPILSNPLYAEMPVSGQPRYFIAASKGSVKIKQPYTYVDLYIPATILGAIIDPISQGVTVENSGDSILISKNDQIVLSSLNDRTAKRKRYQYPSLFNFNEWASNFDEIRQERNDLRWKIIQTPKNLRTEKRLDLVRQYLMTRGDFEALGLLAAAKLYDPSLEKSPYFHSLNGLAHFIAEQYEKAINDFSNTVLANDEEMQLWLELAKAGADPSDANYDIIAKGQRYFKNYPKLLKDNILLIALEVAITQKKNSKIIASQINPEGLSNVQAERLLYLQALGELNSGNKAKAVLELEKLAKSFKSHYKVRSDYLLTRIQAEDGQLSAEQEIKKLEKIRYAWSGSIHEYKLWRRLSDLYAQEKNYNLSLKFLRKSLRHFPYLARKNEIQKLAQKRYEEALFNDQQDIFDILSLAQEYEYLIPNDDDRRIKVQERLIDILVKSDLIERAMGLLTKLLKDIPDNSPDHFRKSIQYSILTLISNQPEKALKTLSKYEKTDSPNELASQSRMVMAQSYLSLGKFDQAREILENDLSNDAFNIVCITYIHQKNWPKLIEIENAYLDSKKSNKVEINPRHVLRLASALLLSKEYNKLQSLRVEYNDLMKKSKYKDIFEIMTSEDADEFGKSAKSLNQLEDNTEENDFIDQSHNKIRQNGLSSFN